MVRPKSGKPPKPGYRMAALKRDSVPGLFRDEVLRWLREEEKAWNADPANHQALPNRVAKSRCKDVFDFRWSRVPDSVQRAMVSVIGEEFAWLWQRELRKRDRDFERARDEAEDVGRTRLRLVKLLLAVRGLVWGDGLGQGRVRVERGHGEKDTFAAGARAARKVVFAAIEKCLWDGGFEAERLEAIVRANERKERKAGGVKRGAEKGAERGVEKGSEEMCGEGI